MLTFLLGAGVGYVLAQGTTRTTILNWLIVTAPKVRDWVVAAANTRP